MRRPEQLQTWVEKGELNFPEEYWPLLKYCGDPDAAVLALLRLQEADADAVECFSQTPVLWSRFLRLAGLSDALADLIIAYPDLLSALTLPVLGSLHSHEDIAAGFAAQMSDAAGGVDEIRERYYALLIEIAVSDLFAADSTSDFPEISWRISTLVDATLEAALTLARRQVPQANEGLSLAVLTLGKAGARELNYISDVDLIFVAKWPEEMTEGAALSAATSLAVALSTIVSGPGRWRPLWPIDTALRPEGKDGALVRGLDSYRSYYQKWAQPWEFQALLKARPVAGDLSLGRDFVAMVRPLVWEVSARPDFVEQSRAMRRRVESNINRQQRERHLKLGPGGLRDVEFTVQLLQLVHGRVDESVRSPNTLEALAQLCEGGYVGRAEAAELEYAYRYLRTLEHRIQLEKLKRSHVVPDSLERLRRYARSFCARLSGEGELDRTELLSAEDLENEWQRLRIRVRELHQQIFYRPLLSVTAALSNEDLRLSESAAEDRLKAIGYLDPRAALRHIGFLTAGVSRRASIVRQVLPAMLGWLADGANPDRGLLEFRIIAEEVGGSQWFGRTLRDSKQAAQRLCLILSSSLYLSDAIKLQPTLIRWLDGEDELAPLSIGQLRTETQAVISRQETLADASQRIRSIRSREVSRAGCADMIFGMDVALSGRRLADCTQVAIENALMVARNATEGADSLPMAVIAMGRLGGRECGYGSDADLVLIHDDAGCEESEATRIGAAVATQLRQILQAEPNSLGVDFDLRPEGKQGPLARSLQSLERYYQDWSVAWERQALVRARPIAGDESVQESYLRIVDQRRWHQPLTDNEIKQIRLLKARMEKERLPRGQKPNRNVKLGPGGLSDVEWTVQLAQLQHARLHPSLRVSSTLVALAALTDAGLVSDSDQKQLREAWVLASKIRAANALALGRTRGYKVDILPATDAQRSAVARILGYPAGAERQLEEDYLRAARHARSVFVRLFQGITEPAVGSHLE
ncbi:bifunctional glutamine-synthetase adenylyltransferase/deadenyltransferase [Boudabousia marimammalium]|uniref:Bifunctional glutamine-synthetase adenylyltransferase/deadenyltransferase n=1 Tax=Boudabousia marimammalium TaxID=156892 RepID=A0A1Q5PRJ1_9ACTO|nr:bifunctional glutamine-synthetase adenylyltransferase/deadenyltransferase [Boudabousia marimammalium]